MEVIVIIATLVAIERALCVWLYENVPTYYTYIEYRWLDILFRVLKFIGASSILLLIGMGWGALVLIWLGYWLAFILRWIVFRWIRKDNGE